MEDIELGNGQQNDIKTGFVGMGKEELMKYANDPFWVRLRWFLFILFWVLWAGMLIGAVMIIIAAPKCAPPEPKTWWEEGPLTSVDVTISEEDLKQLKTNGIKGVIVPYPEDTYKPLNATDSYLDFLRKANKTDVNVIVELNPAISNQWFAQSDAKQDVFNEYYLWGGHEGVGDDNLPNNWLAKDSTDSQKKSAWAYSQNRKQFYLAQNGTPRLNFRVPKVVKEFSDVIETFLDAGAKGFRLNGAASLLVDSTYAPEALNMQPGDYSQDNYNFYTHTKTENLPELGPLLKQWRDLVKNRTDHGVFMLGSDLIAVDAYKVNGSLIVDLPKQSKAFADANKLKENLNATLNLLGENSWPLWQVPNTELPADVLYPVAYLLRGSLVIDKDFKLEQELMEARKSPSVIFGSQDFFSIANRTVFAYVRIHSGNPGYVVALNPTNETVIVDFSKEIPKIPDEVTVQYLSGSYSATNGSTIALREKKSAQNIPLNAKSSVVLSYVPKEKTAT